MNSKQYLLIMVTPCLKNGEVIGHRAATFHSTPGAKPKEVIAKTRTEALKLLADALIPLVDNK